jgi:hypothetical protein
MTKIQKVCGRDSMLTDEKCSFFRSFETPNQWFEIGYCDLEGDWVTCGRKVAFCEKPNALIKFLYLKWEKMRKHEASNRLKSKSIYADIGYGIKEII